MTNPEEAVENELPTFDFEKESAQMNSLIGAWETEIGRCKKRRELRENRKDVYEERQKKTILEDETIIPDRTINSNIGRSKVAYKNFITQSMRTLIITDVEAPKISIDPLELWFTRGMRHPGWKTPWAKLIDAMHVHGGAAMEVVYDPDKPFNCALEFVNREDLIFSLKAKDLQSSPRILRAYEVSVIQLEQFVAEHGFNETIAKKLLDKYSKQEEFIKIYRMLSKHQGVVFNSWYTRDCSEDWLREPRQHDIGLFQMDYTTMLAPVLMPSQDPMAPPQSLPLYLTPEWDAIREQAAIPAPLRAYPIFWFPYQEVENEHILEVQGRCSLDQHVQEAMTMLYSDTVNGAHRASQFFPCAEEQPGGDEKLIELGPLKHGVVMSRKISVFQPNWPNNIALSILQALKVGKADESGQMDFAATARKDANKTAKEMELATQQSNTVVTSDLDSFSSPVLSVYALCFNIASQQAIFKLCKRPPTPELLVGDYNLQAAGDVEVVKRAEDKANAKEFFNIVQGTPAAEKILKFLIQRFFPDQADEWLAALAQPDLKVLIAELLNILSTLPLDEFQLPPEQISNIRNIIAAASNVAEIPNNGNAPGGAQGQGAQDAPAMPQAQ